MKRRPFRRTALVLGLIALVKAADFAEGVIATAFPGSGLGRFVAIKRGA